MTPRLFSTRRRRISAGLVVAILALGVGVSQGLAGARGNGSATAPLQYHNANCGIDTGKKFVGTAKFTLKGGILTVSVSLHGADPGDYRLFVYTGDCNNSWLLGSFKVDSSGEGEKSGSVNVSGYGRSFFADPSGAGHANDSLIVNL